MPGAHVADVIVVGLGAHGSATLRCLSASGVKALGIDRFTPPHAFGSSHGETRITRQAVGEGDVYAPLVLRSHEIWRDLEAETGLDLLLQCGGLIMAPNGVRGRHHGHEDFFGSTVAVANRFSIDHEILDSDEIGRRFPQFGLGGDERAYYEPGAGLVYPERCIEAQLRLARSHGAEIRTDETVLEMDQSGDGVTIRTDKAVYAAGHAVVAAGPWVPGLVGGVFAERLKVHRQTLYWFGAEDPAAYAPGRFPVFIWTWGERPEDYFYGFPTVSGATPGVKVATEQYARTTDPSDLDRSVTSGEERAMYQAQVSGRLRGVGPRCLKSAACLYTTNVDSSFMIDRHPEHDRITVVSACSGHGFKHSAALGEAVASRFTDASRIGRS